MEIVQKRTLYDLRKSEERAHILEGLRIALDNIDEVVALIKGSANADEAKQGLMDNFALDEIQSRAILDMRLQRLTGLETQKILEELEGLVKLIAELRKIIESDELKHEIIRNELLELKEKYGDARRTKIVHDCCRGYGRGSDSRRGCRCHDYKRRLHKAHSRSALTLCSVVEAGV